MSYHTTLADSKGQQRIWVRTHLRDQGQAETVDRGSSIEAVRKKARLPTIFDACGGATSVSVATAGSALPALRGACLRPLAALKDD